MDAKMIESPKKRKEGYALLCQIHFALKKKTARLSHAAEPGTGMDWVESFRYVSSKYWPVGTFKLHTVSDPRREYSPDGAGTAFSPAAFYGSAEGAPTGLPSGGTEIQTKQDVFHTGFPGLRPAPGIRLLPHPA